MRNKIMLMIILIIAFIVSTILIVAEMYYIAAAIIVGLLVVGHREIWSLLKYRKLPPIDERVKGNTSKAMRNSFIFLVIFLALLLLSGSSMHGMPELFIGGILILAEAVYLITYLYYEYMETRLDKRSLKILKIFLLLSAISVFIFLLNAYFPQLIYHDFETAKKFMILDITILCVSALGFVVGIIGSLVLFIKGLLVRAS